MRLQTNEVLSMKTKHLTLCGVLCTVSLTIFVLEAQLPGLVPIPGIKLGLANIITLFALLYLNPQESLWILTSRIILGAWITGNPATLLYALSGGLGCLFLEQVLIKSKRIPVWVVSIFGAITHNLIQLLVAALMTKTPAVFWYLPFLLVAGILTGLFTGLCIFVFDKHSGKKINRFLS